MRRTPELIWAAGLIVAIGGMRLLFPAGDAGDGFGHALGIVGFLLMLATELAYSIRKRKRDRAWGPMRTWLRVHIVMGIVGPFCVLLHAGGQFAGLAGWTSFATVLVVASGFFGRYLYTLIPRASDGSELADADIHAQLQTLEEALRAADGQQRRDLAAQRDRLQRKLGGVSRSRKWLALWHTLHVPLGVSMFVLAFIHIAASIYYGMGVR